MAFRNQGMRRHVVLGALALVIPSTVPISASALGNCSFKPAPPVTLTNMGICEFDPGRLSFAGEPAQQAKCLKRTAGSAQHEEQ